MQIDPRIIGLIAQKGGAYATDLKSVAPDYQEQVTQLKASGFPILEAADPKGNVYYRLDVDPAPVGIGPIEVQNFPCVVLPIERKTAPTQPAAPPDVKPPADAPQTIEKEPTSEPMPPGPQPPDHPYPGTAQDLEAVFMASDFRVQSREGAAPKIFIIPSGSEAALVALDFTMRKPRGALVEVSLRVRGVSDVAGSRNATRVVAKAAAGAIQQRKAETQPEKGEDVPIYEYECPVCHKVFEELQTIAEGGKANCPTCGNAANRLISRPQPAIIKENEKRPAEKGKAQIERELSQQVNAGELPAGLANAQAGLAKL
jgi:putative FmdB family regulatory protein